jgi:hypothetical protein
MPSNNQCADYNHKRANNQRADYNHKRANNQRADYNHKPTNNQRADYNYKLLANANSKSRPPARNANNFTARGNAGRDSRAN